MAKLRRSVFARFGRAKPTRKLARASDGVALNLAGFYLMESGLPEFGQSRLQRRGSCANALHRRQLRRSCRPRKVAFSYLRRISDPAEGHAAKGGL